MRSDNVSSEQLWDELVFAFQERRWVLAQEKLTELSRRLHSGFPAPSELSIRDSRIMRAACRGALDEMSEIIRREWKDPS